MITKVGETIKIIFLWFNSISQFVIRWINWIEDMDNSFPLCFFIASFGFFITSLISVVPFEFCLFLVFSTLYFPIIYLSIYFHAQYHQILMHVVTFFIYLTCMWLLTFVQFVCLFALAAWRVDANGQEQMICVEL